MECLPFFIIFALIIYITGVICGSEKRHLKRVKKDDYDALKDDTTLEYGMNDEEFKKTLKNMK